LLFKANYPLWHLIGHYTSQKINFIHENIYRNDTLGHLIGALLASCPNRFIVVPTYLVDFIAF
tara:strand:- start:6905 stop:7093 length:189 start_codon:yes stop_codon:yes gene_type:complete